jgi:3-hydroxyacyl-[acyl-carrier-protein] dehydratase
MPPEALFDLSQVDFSQVFADREAIRALNPQRYEMEHLDAIVYLDPDQKVVVGYKDVRHDEFWVRGHMPGYPLLPGVLMCETAAQLCSFLVYYLKLIEGDYFGFLGMEDVRFRGSVAPGDRFVVVSRAQRVHPRMSLFMTQGFVGSTMVFNGSIMGGQLNANLG